MRQAEIYLNKALAGILTEYDSGLYSFLLR